MTTTTTAFTLEKLLALESAIADGTLRVKYSDKEIEYNSLKEMLRLREIMRKELGLKNKSGSSGVFGGRRIVGVHTKGLDRE
jgi:hypothetical protein